MDSFRTMRAPLDFASASRGRTLSSVTPPPRFAPVYTLLKYVLSIPSVAYTIPGREDRVSRAATAPTRDESVGEGAAVVSPGIDVESTGAPAVVSAVPVESTGSAAWVEGPVPSPQLLHAAAKQMKRPPMMARSRTPRGYALAKTVM